MQSDAISKRDASNGNGNAYSNLSGRTVTNNSNQSNDGSLLQ